MATNNSSSLYPRRQLGWQTKINTGQYLALYENDEETDLRRIANLVADELEKAEVPPGSMGERQELVEDFRLVTDDVEEMDDVLTRMYDWGDYWRIWFSPVLEAKAQTRDNDYDWRADHNIYPFDTVVVWPLPGGGGATGPTDDEQRIERRRPLDELLAEVPTFMNRAHNFQHLLIEGTYTDSQALEYAELATGDVSIMKRIIDLLLAERAAAYHSVTLLTRSTSGVVINSEGYEPPTAPAQPSAPAVAASQLTPAHYELLDTLLACDIDIDKQAPENAALLRALESHHLVFCYTEDAYGKPCNTYTISSLGETTIRQYQRNTPPSQPEAARATIPAVRVGRRQQALLQKIVEAGGFCSAGMLSHAQRQIADSRPDWFHPETYAGEKGYGLTDTGRNTLQAVIEREASAWARYHSRNRGGAR